MQCGHINKQHYEFVNQKSVQTDISCSLEDGHEGDHSAPFGSDFTYWSDAAGVDLVAKKAREDKKAQEAIEAAELKAAEDALESAQKVLEERKNK